MTAAYRDSVVTFVDILGFRESIHNRPAFEISEMLDAMTKTTGTPIGDEGSGTSIISFSDSIIRVRPTSASSAFEALKNEVQDLAIAQWTLLDLGVLIRGGMTIGDVVVEPGRAFGPAFVRAYDLESSLASTPRVVIDPSTVERIRQHVRSLPHSAARRGSLIDIRRHIRLGDDGIWFVDYYATAATVMPVDEELRGTLMQYKHIIVEKLGQAASVSLALPKILWLARYHNSSVKRIFPADRELRITRQDAPLTDELLIPKLASPRKLRIE